MKLKISLFNKAVFKHNLTGGWCLWAAILLFYLLTLPVSVYGSLSDVLRYQNIDEPVSEMKYVMMSQIWDGMGLFVIFFAFAALLCAMFVFSYLFTGRNSNMMHTFPVSRITLFATNYVTGLLFLIVPVTLSAFLALGAGAIHGCVDGNIMKYYLIWIVTAAVENTFFFSVAVCVLMFVGNMAAVPVIYLILNFLYDGCLFIFQTMISIVCYGLETYSLSHSLGIFTPIIYFQRRIGVNVNIAVNESFKDSFHNMDKLPFYFAAAVLFVVVALIAYEKKHIETAGDVITVKWLKPIFRWGAAICTSALTALLISSMFYTKSFMMIIAVVIVTGLAVFYIAQMLLERSVHVFTKVKLRESVIYTIIICSCYTALNLDVIGLESKLPPVGEIQAVRVDGRLNMLAVDSEEIEWVHDIHRQITDSRQKLKKLVNNNRVSTEYVVIEYLLKDDSILKRLYEIPVLDGADSVSGQIEAYAGKPEVKLKQIFGIHYPEIEVYGGTWESYESDGSMKEVRIAETDARQLYEAIVSDIQDNLGENEAEDGKSKETAEPDTADLSTEEYENDTIGNLVLDVRDEEGFRSVLNISGVRRLLDTETGKDGTAFVSVGKEDTRTVEKLQKLGFIK